jgi:hypothetical protein
MKPILVLWGICCSLIFLESCSGIANPVNEKWINESGNTIKTRFSVPEGNERVIPDADSFHEFLRTLPLKEYGAEVKYYNGEIKKNNDVYCSVVDLPIGDRNLHECADAVMRLKADYLFKHKRYSEIHFNFVSDGKPRYFTDYANGDYSEKKFRSYLNWVYAFANSASLHDEMKAVGDIKEIQPGDVLIQKKNPYGHAVIVVDMAKNEAGEKIVLLAQSYMPAQEIQILVNPNDAELSPWYHLEEGDIHTPEWEFVSGHLKRFK